MKDVHEHTEPAPSPSPSEPDFISLTLLYHGERITLDFLSDATITDLSTTITTDLHIPPETQKLLISPKPGLLKPPFKDPSLLLTTLTDRKITLLGPTIAEQASLTASIAAIKQKQAARATALRTCLLYTSPSPRDGLLSRMPSSA